MIKTKLVVVSFILICGWALSCTSQQNKKEVEQDKVPATRIFFIDKNYWDQTNPLSFIDTLAKYPGKAYFVVTQKPDQSWFDTTMIPAIKKLLSNTQEATFVCSTYENSLHQPLKASTISEQAKYLLDCFRYKDYPKTLCSYHYIKIE